MIFTLPKDEKCVVKSASSYLAWGGLVVNWGISNFGFGEFSYYQKDNIMHCSNECCSLETVSAVFQKALWDMVYINFEQQVCTQSAITQEEVKELFVTKKDHCRVFRTPDKFEIEDNKVKLSFFVGRGTREILCVFDLSTFPDISKDDERDFVISDFMGDGQWDNCYIVASQKNWTQEPVVFEGFSEPRESPKEITHATMKLVDKSLIIDWATKTDSGTLIISSNPHTPGCQIDTQGRDKELVLKVAKRLMKQVLLSD